MDLTLKTQEGYFNFRVAGVIIHNDKVLFMKSDIYYLPGGRVNFGESSQQAIQREIKEELHFDIKDCRPIWMNECFFNENGSKYHEIGIYYLISIENGEFDVFDDEFILTENGRINKFQWIPIKELSEKPVYPLFIREEISNIGDSLKLISTRE